MDLREVPDGPSERHPWERSRYRFFADVLNRAGVLSSSASVLDVGAGDAWFSGELVSECHSETRITCWDVEYGSDSEAALGVEEARISLSRERPEGQFDLILALDVLEHVEDDEELLSALVRENLRPGGSVLVSVPAWQALFTSHDERLLHLRRYSPAMLERLLSSAGLEANETGGLFHSLMVPRALTKLREMLMPGAGAADDSPLAWRRGPVATQLVYGALRLDNLLSRVAAASPLSLPGLSVWAMCKAS